MDQIIFSEISNSNLLHFQTILNKFSTHPLNELNSCLKITKFSLILNDMLTFDPLEIPVRGRECLHWECINESSVEFCINNVCPLCFKTLKDYEKDEFLSEIISKGKFYGVYIFSKTGLYLPFRKNQKNEEEIDWDQDTLKFLSLKNAEILEKSFSYKNKITGIDHFMFYIPFTQYHNREELLIMPCRGAFCKHLQCSEFDEVWHTKTCEICNEQIDDTNIYIDLLQYGVSLFARSKWKKEELLNFEYFSYYPEYNCFQIDNHFFDFDLKEVSLSLKQEIMSRRKLLDEMKRKARELDEEKNYEEPTKEFVFEEEKKSYILTDFVFPGPEIEILEMHYDDIERDIELFGKI